MTPMLNAPMRKRIAQFKSKLEALPHSELPSDRFLKNNFYPFSNERGISSLIESIKATKPQTFEKNTIRVAVVISQSSIWSILKALQDHCDMIVFADINPYLITHTMRFHELLKYASNRQAFERGYQQIENDLLQDFDPSQATPNLAMRKETIGKDHFLYSDENFKEAQDAALKIPFAFTHVNLFHSKDRMKFFECFYRRKCAITFFNATNLYEWDAPVALAKLKSAEQWKPSLKLDSLFSHMSKYKPIIMFSTRENSEEECPLKAQLCSSFEEFWEINERAAQNFINERFPEVVLPDTPDLHTPMHAYGRYQSSISDIPRTPTGIVEYSYELHEEHQSSSAPHTPDIPRTPRAYEDDDEWYQMEEYQSSMPSTPGTPRTPKTPTIGSVDEEYDVEHEENELYDEQSISTPLTPGIPLSPTRGTAELGSQLYEGSVSSSGTPGISPISTKSASEEEYEETQSNNKQYEPTISHTSLDSPKTRQIQTPIAIPTTSLLCEEKLEAEKTLFSTPKTLSLFFKEDMHPISPSTSTFEALKPSCSSFFVEEDILLSHAKTTLPSTTQVSNKFLPSYEEHQKQASKIKIILKGGPSKESQKNPIRTEKSLKVASK
ncbi:MAG: hypothetical protein BGO43_00950 [Gammaproteobacteria bacterium 39-13]|nr:MAG: hypothetical protein BGO43_00950 [Gammaproteobacteria bacterium 39-13]